MRKKVFIVGNGFELSLGGKTSYRDFVASDFWPVRSSEFRCPLEAFLSKKTEIERWYDLESILREYAEDEHASHRKADPLDEPFFIELRDSLSHFIKHEEARPIDEESLAIKVLNAVISNGYFSSIYTFNYTDLYGIAEKAEIREAFDFKFVHGNVARNSIILGVDDHTELREGYGYLRKVFSEHYRSMPIRYDLQECDEVIFFGHSLGDMDYPYFSDFFFTQSHCSNRTEGKSITIFTKDNHSRIQVLEQLRKMNDGQMEPLRNDNDFKIIMTEYPDKDLLKSFFDHMIQDSRQRHEDNLNRLSTMMH